MSPLTSVVSSDGFTVTADMWGSSCNIDYLLRDKDLPLAMASSSFLNKEMLNTKHYICFGLDPHDDHDDFQECSFITSGGVGRFCILFRL